MQCRRCKKGQRERGGIYFCSRYHKRYPDPHGFSPTCCPIFDNIGNEQNNERGLTKLKAELRELESQKRNIISEIESLECELSDKETEKDEITTEIDEIEDEIRDIEAEIKEDEERSLR